MCIRDRSGEAADGAQGESGAGAREGDDAGSAAASSEAARESYLVSPVRGILAACVVAAGLASAMYLGDDMSAGRFAWLAKRRRAFVPAAYIFSAAIDTTVIMCLSLTVFGLSSGFAREAVSYTHLDVYKRQGRYVRYFRIRSLWYGSRQYVRYLRIRNRWYVPERYGWRFRIRSRRCASRCRIQRKTARRRFCLSAGCAHRSNSSFIFPFFTFIVRERRGAHYSI